MNRQDAKFAKETGEEKRATTEYTEDTEGRGSRR
jgi:hypothetical protein